MDEELLQEFVRAYSAVFPDGLNRHEKPVLLEYVKGLREGKKWLCEGAAPEARADASIAAFQAERGPLGPVQATVLKTFLHYLLITKPAELKKRAATQPSKSGAE